MSKPDDSTFFQKAAEQAEDMLLPPHRPLLDIFQTDWTKAREAAIARENVAPPVYPAWTPEVGHATAADMEAVGEMLAAQMERPEPGPYWRPLDFPSMGHVEIVTDVVDGKPITERIKTTAEYLRNNPPHKLPTPDHEPVVIDGQSWSTITVPDSVKMLIETLSAAQSAVNMHADNRRMGHAGRIQRMIDDLERQRPTGSNGKHGDRHTATCGCLDVVDGISPRTIIREAILECAKAGQYPKPYDLTAPVTYGPNEHEIAAAIVARLMEAGYLR